MPAHPENQIGRVFLVAEHSSIVGLADSLRAGADVVELVSSGDAKQIETRFQAEISAGKLPSVVLLALPVERAITAARLMRRLAPSAGLLFLVDPSDVEQFRRKAFHTPLGSYRVVTSPDSSSILASIHQQLRVFEQRKSFRTTIDRINLRLASVSPEPREVRRLLISDRFRASLIFNAVDAIISVDLDRRVTAWNRAAAELFRVSIAEGAQFGNLPLGAFGRSLSDFMATVFSGEEVPRQEIVCRLPDDTPLAIEATFAPVLDDDHKVIGVSIIARDISEAKRAERLLRLEHQITRQLVESTNLRDAIEGVLSALAAETQACVAEFWSVQESAGVIVAEVIWSHPDHEDLAAFTRRSRELRLRRGEGFPGRVWENPARIVSFDPASDPNFPRRDAARDAGIRSAMSFPIAVAGRFLGAINLFGKAALNTDSALFRMIDAVATDLAQWIQRRGAEQALEASERELRALADSIPQLAWIATADGHVFWYNQRWFEYTGATFEQMRGQGWQSVHDPVILPRVLERWSASLNSGLPFEMEFPLRAADGSFRWFLTRAAPVHGTDGCVFRWFGSSTDVDEVRRAREALREAQAELQKHASRLEEEVARRTAQLRETIQELEAFSYSVSHDMRSPLRAMQGYAYALLTDHSANLDDVATGYLRRIQRAASRMDLLIQDVLAYSRVAKGDIQLKKINLEQVIHDVIHSYPAFDPGRASITIQGALPHVLAHEAYVTQIVSNLLGNAVKFVEPGTFPAVTISATTTADTVRLAFRDNGIGIDAQQQKRIFQIFGRVHPDKMFEGTGIGLAIVKKAAERMGGSVGVHSALGHGSEFFVILKRAL